jgi:hypothetical protein
VTVKTLADDLPIQQARVRELIALYRSLPNGSGVFGAVMMEQDLQEADKAVMSGDPVRMLRAWAKLKDCQ